MRQNGGRLGFILSGATPVPLGAEPLLIETPWGDTIVHVGGEDREHVYLRRHGEPYAPPHRVRHRVNIEALALAGARRVLSLNNVGALHRDMDVPSLVVPDDFIDFSSHPDASFHDEEPRHVDVSAPYCATLRAALVDAAATTTMPVKDGGTYVTTRGPRLETRAEVRHLATLGDIVGMTGGPEATLARERGLCYGSLCVAVNHAAGLAGPLEGEAIIQAFQGLSAEAMRALESAADKLGSDQGCAACRNVP